MARSKSSTPAVLDASTRVAVLHGPDPFLKDLHTQRLADYEVSNWYLCHHPQSHFLQDVVAARSQPGRRYALRGGQLTTHHTGGPSEHRLLTSGAELRAALEGTFGIAVPQGADVDAALDRVLPAPMAGHAG